VRGHDAPDTLVSLCFVDDFTRVGHLRAISRTIVALLSTEDSIAVSSRAGDRARRGLMKKTQHPAVRSLAADFLGYLSTRSAPLSRVARVVPRFAMPRCSRLSPETLPASPTIGRWNSARTSARCDKRKESVTEMHNRINASPFDAGGREQI